MHRLLIYFGNTLIGDINRYAKNKHLVETLKSEATSGGAVADSFTFSVNWKIFQQFTRERMSVDAARILRVGKMRVVLEIDGKPRFAGFLAARPARNGLGAEQVLSLTFYEHFARLAGEVMTKYRDPTNPMRHYANAQLNNLINLWIGEFIWNAAQAGETLGWTMGKQDHLGNKTVTYKDYPTLAKVFCDMMNNVEGVGKFDIVFRVDPEDYTKVKIDTLKPRGTRKNIIIQYPSDGVYKLWASDYSVEESNEFASHIIVAGNGQVGDSDNGEQTAKIGLASNPDFVKERCYWRVYESASNLYSQTAVDQYAATRISQLAFENDTPQITLVGRPIAWGEADNMDNGLAIGDTFYFQEDNDDGEDTSGFYRIIGMDTTWDDNDVATVTPTLMEDA